MREHPTTEHRPVRSTVLQQIVDARNFLWSGYAISEAVEEITVMGWLVHA